MSVQALYVDPRGPYPKMLGPGACWDEKRDARNYTGPDPVIAHPPCGPWGSFKHLYRGSADDRALALLAVQQVRAYGGVLEHPANSKLWPEAGLPEPGLRDAFGGWTLQVNQVEWGHACVKPTRLYIVGCEPFDPSPPFPGRQPTHGIWFGSFEFAGRAGPKLIGASKEIRRRTPPNFAAFLKEIAEKRLAQP